MPRSVLRRGIVVAASAAVLGAGVTPIAYAGDAHRPARRAADWQAGQLSNGVIHNNQYDFDDYGLTVDTLFALHTAHARPKAQRRIVKALRENVRAAIGDGAGGTYSGSAAKLLAGAASVDARPRSFGGVNLVKRTRSLVDRAGADKGRLKDDVAGGDDFSNLIGQAYALQGLTAAHAGMPSVKRFLLKQQCRPGFFRITYNDAASNPKLRCSTAKPKNRVADLDATAIVLSAMVSARRHGAGGLRAPSNDAARWLLRQQGRNGAFRTGGKANANSTGVAGYALAKAGKGRAAARAAVWLAGRQATPNRVRGTKLAKDPGAIAFDEAALRKGRRSGITKLTRDQWRRSTAQAILGLRQLHGKKFRVSTGRNAVRAGARVRVRARGLVPGEKYTVSVAGKVRGHGLAGAKGVATTRVRVPRGVRPGRRAVVVHGAGGPRVGRTHIRVKRAAQRADSAAATSQARKGYAGKCKTRTRKGRKGVTVVVDFRRLGSFRKHNGRTIVRCAPARFTRSGKVRKRTGLKVLRHAGISFRGTRLSGNAYVCRIDGRPARDEPIRIPGDRNYKERCIRTPPRSAFWSYWHANGKGQKWRYSSTGAGSRYAVPGGFEGWAFARDAERGDYPKPRVRPRRR